MRWVEVWENFINWLRDRDILVGGTPSTTVRSCIRLIFWKLQEFVGALVVSNVWRDLRFWYFRSFHWSWRDSCSWARQVLATVEFWLAIRKRFHNNRGLPWIWTPCYVERPPRLGWLVGWLGNQKLQLHMLRKKIWNSGTCHFPLSATLKPFPWFIILSLPAPEIIVRP